MTTRRSSWRPSARTVPAAAVVGVEEGESELSARRCGCGQGRQPDSRAGAHSPSLPYPTLDTLGEVMVTRSALSPRPRDQGEVDIIVDGTGVQGAAHRGSGLYHHPPGACRGLTTR